MQNDWSDPGKKIAVVGTCGAGKTSFADAVSMRLELPHVELDRLHWAENWVEVPDDVFRTRVCDALTSDRWIVDGNYGVVRDLVWQRVESVVWLDYSFGVVMVRLLQRTLTRIILGAEIWHGNKETWYRQFCTRESILLWGISTYFRRRRDYLRLMQSAEYQHVNFVRLRTPSEAQLWLNQLPQASKRG